jgi:hypothetical protein
MLSRGYRQSRGVQVSMRRPNPRPTGSGISPRYTAAGSQSPFLADAFKMDEWLRAWLSEHSGGEGWLSQLHRLQVRRGVRSAVASTCLIELRLEVERNAGSGSCATGLWTSPWPESRHVGSLGDQAVIFTRELQITEGTITETVIAVDPRKHPRDCIGRRLWLEGTWSSQPHRHQSDIRTH